MKFKIIPFFLLFTTSANADQPAIKLSEKPTEVPTTAYIGTDSICLDGLVAALSGHGCKNIHMGKAVDKQYEITCTNQAKSDSITNGRYIIVELGSDIKDDHIEFDKMCVDANLLILRAANIK